MQIPLTAKEFLMELRSALGHLYEPFELKRSRLIPFFSLETVTDRPAALRKILQNGIQSLKADDHTPGDSSSARIYEVLYYRYIEHSALKEVAAELALSIRQVHRIETAGLEMLSEHLRTQYKIELMPGEGRPAEARVDAKTSEMEWLRKSSKDEDINLSGLVESVIGTIQPLTQQKHINIQIHCENHQTWVRGDPTILRQIVMNSLVAAFQFYPEGCITASVHLLPEGVCLTVVNEFTSNNTNQEEKIHETIDLIRQFVSITGGSLESSFMPGSCLRFALIFPTRDRILVMVVDDNADALLLMERYLTGTVYQFLGVRDPAQVISMVQEHCPQILVLDVMLPGTDGWQLLSNLKDAALLKDTQVIVSTILPQESLALAFHASGFLRKPVTREVLLTMLDQISSPVEKE